MSRLAKKPIQLPGKVEVSVSGDNTVTVKGPLGALSRAVPSCISIVVTGASVQVSPKNEADETGMHLGTAVAHIRNMVKGVTEGFSKKLIIEGIGFKADIKGSLITLSLGFSHQIKATIPAGLTVTVEKNVMTITGNDIEAVGLFAAQIRANKKPEPYKGKGIRYEGEVIRRKQGKKTT